MSVPLFRPDWTPKMEEAALHSLRNEFFILGDSVAKFEEAFARYCGTKHAVSVSSGTHALHFAFLALGLKPGDEVLTSPSSFIASANAIMHAGATPTFADVDQADANLDPVATRLAVTKNTKALLPVHLYGRTADMKSLGDLARDKQIPIIEDACQAHGATFGGKRTGSMGKVGCFSFYTTKNLYVGGDGGMVTTDDESIAETIRSLRNSGRGPGKQYEHDAIGYTARLNSVNCAIGLAILNHHLDAWTQRRQQLANQYRAKLKDLPLRLPPTDTPGRQAVYHLFTVNTTQRDALQTHLKAAGIGTGIHYPIPIHQQPVYQQMFGRHTGAFPVAEQHSRTTLSLPLYPAMSDAQQDEVVAAITSFFGRNA